MLQTEPGYDIIKWNYNNSVLLFICRGECPVGASLFEGGAERSEAEGVPQASAPVVIAAPAFSLSQLR